VALDRTFTLVVAPEFTLDSSGIATRIYTYEDVTGGPAARGGNTPVRFSATGLPQGVTVNAATGALVGRPARPGLAQVRFTATDDAGYTRTADLELEAVAPVVLSANGVPRNAKTDLRYNGVPTVSGGVAGYRWSAVGLPDWLSLDAATGALTGTPRQVGSHPMTLTVTDSDNRSTSVELTIAVAQTDPLLLNVGAVPTVLNRGATVNANLSATGGNQPFRYSASDLPAGLTLSAAGVLSGNVSSDGVTTARFTVADETGYSDTKSVVISVAPAMALSTAGLPGDAITGAPYSGSPSASGGRGAYRWTASNLPAGLSIDADTGAISGRPTSSGTVVFGVTARDLDGRQASATRTLVTTDPAPIVLDVTGMARAPMVDTVYASTPTATGGYGTFTWSATGLPAGLSIDGASGAVTGTVVATGVFPAEIKVTDTLGASKTATVKIAVASTPLRAQRQFRSEPRTYVGDEDLAMRVFATGGNDPYRWSGTNLPPGMAVDPETGNLTGVPTTPSNGFLDVTMTVTDEGGRTSSVTQTIQVAAALAFDTSGLADSVAEGKQYLGTLSTSGGFPPHTITVSGLPSGLSYSSGRISGVPAQSGSFTVRLRVSDVTGRERAESFLLTVVPKPKANAVAAGADHRCAILSDTTMRCWGSNSFGQLGNRDAGSGYRDNAVVVTDANGNPMSGWTMVGAAGDITCGVLAGQAWCWGRGDAGHLGNGGFYDSNVPVQVMTEFDGTPYGDKPLGGVTALAVGDAASCAISRSLQYCWGRTRHYGKAGDETRASVKSNKTGQSIAVADAFACSAETNVPVCVGPIPSGLTYNTNSLWPWQYVATLHNLGGVEPRVKHVAASGDSVCWWNDGFGTTGLPGRGYIRCYGSYNATIDLGSSGYTMSKISLLAMGAGTQRLCFSEELATDSDVNFTLKCRTGSDAVERVQDSSGNELDDVRSISLGGSRSCVVTANQDVACWASDQSPTGSVTVSVVDLS
jgi:hypothetical protein